MYDLSNVEVEMKPLAKSCPSWANLPAQEWVIGHKERNLEKQKNVKLSKCYFLVMKYLLKVLTFLGDRREMKHNTISHE